MTLAALACGTCSIGDAVGSKLVVAVMVTAPVLAIALGVWRIRHLLKSAAETRKRAGHE